MTGIESSLKALRIFQVAMLLSVGMYVAVGEMVGAKAGGGAEPIKLALIPLAVLMAGLALFFQIRQVRPAQETLRQNPGDSAALSKWRGGNLASMVAAEAVALFGLVLRITGASLWDAAPFYAVGALLMIVWTPRRPT